MLIVICSSSKSKNMSGVSQEIRDYFSKQVKPLATNGTKYSRMDQVKFVEDSV